MPMSPELRAEIASTLIENASTYDTKSSNATCVDVASTFCEPGYSLDGDLDIIVLANWNDDSRWDQESQKCVVTSKVMGRLCRALEWLGCTIEWSDEWTHCGQCCGLLRTSPDSYGWKPAYVELEGDIYCEACAKEDPDSIIDLYNGNSRKALTINDADEFLEEQGWVRYNEEAYEHGLHAHQADNPRIIAKSLHARGVENFIFTIDSCGQFDMDFSVWVKPEDLDKLREPIKTEQDVSPAELCRRGLQEASLQQAQLPDGDGVKYSKIKADGTAETRLVSPEEFINGIKD